MLRPFSQILLILIGVSCSIPPNAIPPTQIRSSTELRTSTSTVASTATTPPETLPPTAATVSPGVGSTRIIVLQATSPAPVAGPLPTIARATTPPARTGWQTYVNANLHLALEYPPDWTVTAENTGAVFTSAQSLTIHLVPIEPSALAPSDEMIQPNTRCSDTVNPHGIPVRSCLATIGFSLNAYLDLKTAGGAESAVDISTISRGAFDVFNAFVESARIAP